jgi:hypothetical protein
MNRTSVLPLYPMKFMAILGLAFIPVFSPLTGHTQLSALHRSNFKMHNLSTREGGKSTSYWTESTGGDS